MGLISSWDDQLEMKNHKGSECLCAVTGLSLTASQPNVKCANHSKSRVINQSTARPCLLTVLKGAEETFPRYNTYFSSLESFWDTYYGNVYLGNAEREMVQ